MDHRIYYICLSKEHIVFGNDFAKTDFKNFYRAKQLC